MFTGLERVEEILSKQPFLAGDVLTEADVSGWVGGWLNELNAISLSLLSSQHPPTHPPTPTKKVRLFPTLIRFDAVYATLFKCTKKPISSYPHLSSYLRQFYQLKGVKETIDLPGCIQSYFVQVTYPPTHPPTHLSTYSITTSL